MVAKELNTLQETELWSLTMYWDKVFVLGNVEILQLLQNGG